MTGQRSWPIIRTNALPVIKWPQAARLVRCQVQTWREMRDLVKAANVDVIVARRDGVIGFGSDEAFKKAFETTGKVALDFYPIEPRRLLYDSAEHSLLLDALLRAIVRNRPLQVTSRPGRKF